jgi:dihydroorotate dehydrogenase
VGAATPRAQPGNPRPRLFRLTEDRAAINRFGFNNDGAEAIAARLAPAPPGCPSGLNLGANKDSADRAADFAAVLALCGPQVDFATVNVSSPNTERLRDLQGRAALAACWPGDGGARRPAPPDPGLPEDRARPERGRAGRDRRGGAGFGVDGIIATNTTPGARRAEKPHAGRGAACPARRCSNGRPACWRGCRADRRPPAADRRGRDRPAEQAYAKIRAGASAVQLYTAMVYEGISLPARLAQGLDALLARDGHATVATAVGTDRATWL